MHSTCGDSISITLRGVMEVTDPPKFGLCHGQPTRSLWVFMEAGSRTTAISITATQQPKPNAHPHALLFGLWVLSLGAGAPSKSGAAFTERQQHSKRRGERHGEKVPKGGVAQQAPSGSGMASAKWQ